MTTEQHIIHNITDCSCGGRFATGDGARKHAKNANSKLVAGMPAPVMAAATDLPVAETTVKPHAAIDVGGVSGMFERVECLRNKRGDKGMGWKLTLDDGRTAEGYFPKRVLVERLLAAPKEEG